MSLLKSFGSGLSDKAYGNRANNLRGYFSSNTPKSGGNVQSLIKDAIKGAFVAYVGEEVISSVFSLLAGRAFSVFSFSHGALLCWPTLFINADKGTRIGYSNMKGEFTNIIMRSSGSTDTSCDNDVKFASPAVCLHSDNSTKLITRIPYKGSSFFLIDASAERYHGVWVGTVLLLRKAIKELENGSRNLILYKNSDKNLFREFLQEWADFTAEMEKHHDQIWIAKPGTNSKVRDASTSDGPIVNQSIYAWSAYSFAREKKVFLDDLPIHTDVRAKIDRHIAWCKTSWGEDQPARHRAIMLSGSPGTGKSSIAYAMAAELESRLYEFPDEEVSKTSFWDLIHDMTSNSVMVADEIDSHRAFKSRINYGLDPNRIVKYDASVPLLPGIDQKCIFDYLSGPKSPKNILTVMITNYPKKIDAAIKREGRTKEEIFVGNVNHAGLVRWLEHTFNRPYEGPEFIDMPMKYIFSCHEDAYTYEELIEALHKYDPNAEVDILRQEDELGG